MPKIRQKEYGLVDKMAMSNTAMDDSTTEKETALSPFRILSNECHADFSSVANLDGFVNVETELLRSASNRYMNMLADEQQLIQQRENLPRAVHFPLEDLEKVIAETKASGCKYVKIYMAIDDENKPFLFSAPIDDRGRGINTNNIVAMSCTKIPPCPNTVADVFMV